MLNCLDVYFRMLAVGLTVVATAVVVLCLAKDSGVWRSSSPSWAVIEAGLYRWTRAKGPGDAGA